MLSLGHGVERTIGLFVSESVFEMDGWLRCLNNGSAVLKHVARHVSYLSMSLWSCTFTFVSSSAQHLLSFLRQTTSVAAFTPEQPIVSRSLCLQQCLSSLSPYGQLPRAPCSQEPPASHWTCDTLISRPALVCSSMGPKSLALAGSP